ncbi:hypothetical protein Tco_1213638 [Tanacetum coccineum]
MLLSGGRNKFPKTPDVKFMKFLLLSLIQQAWVSASLSVKKSTENNSQVDDPLSICVVFRNMVIGMAQLLWNNGMMIEDCIRRNF